jgi:hypothetical protein
MRLDQPLSLVVDFRSIPRGFHAGDRAALKRPVASAWCRDGDGSCGVHLGGDVGEMKRRGSATATFLWGTRKSSLFTTGRCVPPSLTRSRHDEEVEDHGFVLYILAIYGLLTRNQTSIPSPSSTLHQAPAQTSNPMPTSQMSKTQTQGANTTLLWARAN